MEEKKPLKRRLRKQRRIMKPISPDAENDDSDSVSSKIVMVLVTITYYCNMAWNICSFVKGRCGWLWLDCALRLRLKDVPPVPK